MTYTKKEIQKRVIKNGKPLPLTKFMWDEKTRTLSSRENNLVVDFSDIHWATIIAYDSTTITAGGWAVIYAGSEATIKARSEATIKVGHYANITAGTDSIIATWDHATIKAGNGSKITAGYFANIKAGNAVHINACDNAIITVGHWARIKAYCNANIKAGHNANIMAWHMATIIAGHYANITAENDSIITSGDESIAIRQDIHQVIELEKDAEYQFLQFGKKGCLKDGYLNGDRSLGKHILADGVLSKILEKKKNGDVTIYKVINENDTNESYIVKSGKLYAHGKTIKQAKLSLIYKISDRDTSEYNNYNLDTVLSFEHQVQMYRKITGSCETQTKEFAETKTKKDRTIKEVIEITKGQYGSETLKAFFYQRNGSKGLI